jgi:hypothetical protein
MPNLGGLRGPLASLAVAAAMSGPTPVAASGPPAGITRLEITSVERPTFDGRTFGRAGAYEKLRGRAYGEIDPDDPRNAVITDLKLAPRNARGRVEYSMDVYILKPVELARGNHKLFFEVNNRGLKYFGALNQSTGGNDPKTAGEAGGGFLFEQGYSLAWSGWDPTAPAGGDNLQIAAPAAKAPGGGAITGPAFESLSFDEAVTHPAALTYPAASLDKGAAKLTVRAQLNDPRREIPATGWDYVDARHIRLSPEGTAFRPGAIYEFSYTAKDPVVGGVGFAATRDFVDFLRHGTTGNPLAGDVARVLAYTVSQPSRYMNDFLWLGFNQGAAGGRVFDGVESWLGAGTGVQLNVRFGQPSRTERARRDHLFPEAPFPFAYPASRDHLTGGVDGRGVRCAATGTCPKMMLINSSNEYWAKTASLLHTDSEGRARADLDEAGVYLISSVEHTVGGSPPTPGICAQRRNPTDAAPALRALFLALDAWLDGTPPPASRAPRASAGEGAWIKATADSGSGVGAVSAAELGWPAIPGVQFTGVATLRNRWDFGPEASRGILGRNPPAATGEAYAAFVPRVDADGLDVAGIRLPPVAAPTATLTGWGLRGEGFGGPDACESFGQQIPFAATRAERLASGDPRRSLEERYPTHGDYVAAVTAAARGLQAERLLTAADAERYIAAAAASDVRK